MVHPFPHRAASDGRSKFFSCKHAWALVLFSAAAAQASDGSCITAGRFNAEGQWAPQFQTVRLLDEAGRPMVARGKADLSRVRAVELTEPALLSTCDGSRDVKRGEDPAAAKAAVPAARPGRLTVEGVGFPRLQTGGELVELKVQVPADRIVMLTR